MVQPVYVAIGVPDDTVRVMLEDAVVRPSTLAALQYQNRHFIAAWITVYGQAIRYSFRVDPIQGAAGVGFGHVLGTGGTLRLASGAAWDQFRMVNQVAQNDSEVHITLEFETR